jgi:hypothetical protein
MIACFSLKLNPSPHYSQKHHPNDSRPIFAFIVVVRARILACFPYGAKPKERNAFGPSYSLRSRLYSLFVSFPYNPLAEFLPKKCVFIRLEASIFVQSMCFFVIMSC